MRKREVSNYPTLDRTCDLPGAIKGRHKMTRRIVGRKGRGADLCVSYREECPCGAYRTYDGYPNLLADFFSVPVRP